MHLRCVGFLNWTPARCVPFLGKGPRGDSPRRVRGSIANFRHGPWLVISFQNGYNTDRCSSGCRTRSINQSHRSLAGNEHCQTPRSSAEEPAGGCCRASCGVSRTGIGWSEETEAERGFKKVAKREDESILGIKEEGREVASRIPLPKTPAGNGEKL